MSDRQDHIEERGGKWVLLSYKDPSKVLGIFATKEEAVKREQEIQAFKNDSPDGYDMKALDETGMVSASGYTIPDVTRSQGVGAPIAPMPDGVSATMKQDCLRLDVGRIDGSRIERTPQGGLKVPAFLTREGVFRYRNDDGTLRLEYRPAQEVFHSDSLKSLEDAPVTDLHRGLVRADNFSDLSKGHVRDIKRDGKFVAATMLVQDAGLIAAIERGDRKEVSCGYSCKFDPTPGVTASGEHYDGIQTDIRYNHAALLPKGAGRAGSEVSLRLDGGAVQVANHDPQPRITMTVKLDDKEYEYGSKEHVEALEAKAVAATAERDAARADAADARDPAKMAKRVEKRSKILARATEILGKDFRADGLTNHQVREACVLKTDPSVQERLDSYAADEGKKRTYIKARFDALSNTYSNTLAGVARAAMVLSTNPVTSQSAYEGTPIQEAWRMPLAMSKGA